MTLVETGHSRDAVTPTRRGRVLVVDDDPGIRQLCASNLQLDGFDVIEAADGQAGLECVTTHAPDLVLLDINMPVLDGLGFAAALRSDASTRHLPLVFLTGETEREAEARALGAAGYFTKPFDPVAISRFVGEMLAESVSKPDAA